MIPPFIRDDSVLRETHWLAIFVSPFLVAAAVLLLVWPANTAQTFAWPINPPMTAMMLGSAYLGGLYFFIRVAMARRWHTIQVGFLPVATFAGLLGVATVLHWDRFTHDHISFIAWAGLYFTAPFLVVIVWLRNRVANPERAAGDLMLPRAVRWGLGIMGAVEIAVGLMLFLQMAALLAGWPWKLTPLTARVMGAMVTMPGVVELGIALDGRWSAARVTLESQAFSLLLILISAARDWGDFNAAAPSAWIFAGGLSILLVGIVGLYGFMQRMEKSG